MIIRYGGGNDGIKDYLENGRKVDRHFSRDELDRRIPIEGDLNVTQAVIDSIDDHGQERYLHITMSFHEPDITEEKMAEVFQQYKRELMTAYGDDEFNVYAEIHWPKIKETYNHQTERMEPRFPHVHVVLPKRNLLTGGFLDPCSMQQRSVKYFDAIQEKLNRDNGLSSPRNSPRIGTNHYEAALGKYKDKEFKTKNGELKRDIFNAMLARDVRTVSEFKALISEFGEVRARNEGKDNEYFAIRVSGDKKFTNLKANIFDKQFIENRALTLEPVTDAQVARRVDTWRNIQSKEIKFISNASAKVKETYKSLSLPERRQFLADRESYYEQRYREQPAGRKESHRPTKTKLPGLPEGNYKSSHLEFARGFQAEGARHLHELRASNVDHFRPEEDAADRLLLQGDADDDLQHLQPHGGTGLRRDLYAGGGQGGLTDSTDPQSSVLTSLIEAEREKEQQKADLQHFAEIRKNLDPQHLLAFAQIRFGVDPEKHPVSKARDGSPRIKAGKLNLNVSDFLTKHIGLEWAEASQVLLELYEKQQRGIVDKPKSKVAHIDDWRRFRDEVYPKNIRTYEELKNQIKVSYSLGMKSINAEYFSRRKSITNDSTLSRTDKHYFRSVVILEKLQKVESLQHRVKEQNSLTDRVKYPYSTLFYDFATKNEEI
ncbi:TPA: relaxase/mobilization nuclease domain-containing protein, partial [Pseudomonas aeruginosa]|nr:relaxase/mobilization nuclease domain-containing protein [Pseudomonas aeruginosa]